MAQTSFIDIPFGGQSDAASAKMLPNGLFERVSNGDLDQYGAISIRQGFSPLDMSAYTGTLIAFDLYSHGENLLALGTTAETFPVDLYTYNNQVAAVPWRALAEPLQRGIGQGTDVRLVGGLPFTGSNIFGLTVAATNGLVAVSCSAFSTAGAVRTLHIFNPATDATIVLNKDELTAAGGTSWAIALGSDFGWVRQNPVTGVVVLSTIDVTGPAAPALTVGATLFSDSDPTVPMVVASDATAIHVLYRVAASNNVIYRQFTHAGVQNGTGKVVFSASATTQFAMSLNTNGTQVHTLVKVNSTTLSLLTFSTTSPFTTAAGATSITTAAQSALSGCEVLGIGATEVDVFYTTSVSSNTSLVVERRSPSTHALASTLNYDNFALAGGAIALGGRAFFTAKHVSWQNDGGSGTGATCLLRKPGSASQALSSEVIFYEDRQIMRINANSAGGGNGAFNLALASSNLYVTSGFNTSEASMQGNIREVKLQSTARRPGVELGGLLYLAGGQVLVTDGKQLAESGMPPAHLDSTVSQGTDGSLSQGGLYKYRGVYEWYDWKGNKHLSPVSHEVEVQLTGANDAVTVTTQIPPSLRSYPPGDAAASAPQFKLFRTETNLQAEPAVLTIAPTSAQLNSIGLGGINALETLNPANRLQLDVNGAGLTAIDFSAAATNLAVVGQEIVAAFPTLTSSVDETGTILTLTTVLEGTGASIAVAGVGVTLLLGLAIGQTVSGTTDAAAGEIFFLTATQQLITESADTIYAEFITVTDRTADSDLIDNETLYTTGDRGAVSGVLDFAPPLPGSYITATRDRLVVGGGNEVVQFSQKAFPNEAVAFVDVNLVGPVGFAYQARVEGRITGVAALDESVLIGTRDELFIVGGDGPNYVGIGELSVPARLPSETGIYDWRSIAITSEGLWFQGDLDKLYLLPRGGGAPQWAGEHVSTRLGGFISGAAVTEGDTPRVAFAIGDASRMVVRDIRSSQWFEYALPATPARSLIEHRGDFYFVDDVGTIWGPSAFSDNGAAIPLVITSGTFAPFGLNRQGRLRVVQLLASFKAAATVKLEVSLDEGVNYADMGTFTVTGLTTDAPVRLEWFVHPQRGDRFKFRWTMTPSAATQGLVLHGASFGVVASKGETKLPSSLRK